MAHRRVLVTGIGVAAPLGIGVDAFRTSLLRGESGVRPITLFEPGEFPVRVAAEVPGFDDTLVAGDSRYLRVMSRAMKLAVVAASEAVVSARLDAASLAETACVAAVGRHDMTVPEFGPGFARAMRQTDGGFEFDRTAYLTRGVRAMHPLWLLTFIPNLAISHIAATTGVRGEANTLTTEGAAGLQAIAEAAASIRDGAYDVALCGGCDARITPVGLARSLSGGMLAEATCPNESRPYDETRRGFVAGEGAAFFVLEESERARARGARALAEVTGWGEASDAYDPWRAHPEGRGLRNAMRSALSRAGRHADEVDLVVACAASMPDLDAAEAAALDSTFEARSLAVTAPASSLGRAHAAAGALAAAAGLVALVESAIPPTINTRTPMDGAPRGLVTGTHAVAKQLSAVVVNGYALGGECASVVLERADG